MLRSMLAILLLAACGALLFNWLAPQGIGWLPPEIGAPLWTPATPRQALELRAQGAMLVDARDPGDYKQAHLRGAVNFDPAKLDFFWKLLEKPLRAAPAVVVHGRTISRFPAATVGQYLAGKGLARVYVLSADFPELERAGFAVRRARRSRQ